MAKMKVTLGKLPNFKLPVDYVMPNGEEARIVFTVKHRKTSEIQSMYDSNEPVSDHEMITALAVGWDLEEEFNKENIEELLDLFPGIALSLTGHYMRALAGQRVKS